MIKKIISLLIALAFLSENTGISYLSSVALAKEDALRPHSFSLTGDKALSAGFQSVPLAERIGILIGRDNTEVIDAMSGITQGGQSGTNVPAALDFICSSALTVEDNGNILKKLSAEYAMRLLVAVSINAQQARATRVSFSTSANAAHVTMALRHAIDDKGVDFTTLRPYHVLPETVSNILSRNNLVTYGTATQDGSNLEFDISKALAGQVGSVNGVAPEELESIASRLDTIKADIASGSQDGTLNRPHMISPDDIARINEVAGTLNRECEDIIVINAESVGAKGAFDALTDPFRNRTTSKEERGGARVHFIENPDIEHIDSLFDALKDLNRESYPQEIGVIIISENLASDPMTQAIYQSLKAEIPQLREVFITNELPDGEGPRVSFLLEESGLGGFFSAAGLLPLALAGVDIEGVVNGARTVLQNPRTAEETQAATTGLDNFAYLSSAIYYLLSKPKQDVDQETHIKNIIALMFYSEMGKGLASIFADTMNRALVGPDVWVDHAVGTKYQHFNLQAFQKAYNYFLVHTLGVRNFDNDLTIGPSASPHYAGKPMSNVFHACRQGVREALQSGSRPNIDTTVERLNPHGVGVLVGLAQLQSVVLSMLFDSTSLSHQAEEIEKLHKEAAAIHAKPAQAAEGFLDMSTPSGIRINCDGVLESAIGDKNGLTPEELNKLILHLLQVQVALQEEGPMEHPWREVPEAMREQLPDLERQAKQFTADCDDIVLIGAGGSSAGNIAGMDIFLSRFFNLLSGMRREGFPRVTILGDNIDPDYINNALGHFDPEKTRVIVVSKSGLTAEPNIALATIKEDFRSRGEQDFSDHVCAITDMVDGILIQAAKAEGFRKIPHPEEVGGRWTLFTVVSAFLLAAEGIDLETFYRTAHNFIDTCYGIDAESLKAAHAELSAAMAKGDDVATSEASAKALGLIKQNPALLYGGLIATLNEKKGKDISTYLILQDKMRGFREWLIQLKNESLGKPGVRLFTIARHGLRAIVSLTSKLIHTNRCTYTVINSEPPTSHKKSPIYSMITSYAEALRQKLLRYSHPVVTIDTPVLDEAVFAELALLFFGETVVEARSFMDAKAVNPYNQPGVSEAKRRTLERLEQEARTAHGGEEASTAPESIIDLATVVPGIDGELRVLIESMVTRLWPNIAGEIQFGGFGRPDLRERKLAGIVMSELTPEQFPSLNGIWLRNAANPRVLNENGRFTVAVSPIEQSASLEGSNVSTGALFGIYDGKPNSNNLVASFFLLKGPSLGFIGYVAGKQGDNPIRCVYDFKRNETGKLEPRISLKRADIEPWVEMRFKGDRSALHGREADWPPAFKNFKRDVWDRRPLAVRYSNSLADVYEVLLNGGLWMEVVTPLEAVLLGNIFESAGGYGRSLIMTKDGPMPASSIDLTHYQKRFSTDSQVFAWFGSKEIIDILEAYLNFLGSGLDLKEFATKLSVSLQDSGIEDNPELRSVLLTLNFKLQGALRHHLDREEAADVTGILSEAINREVGFIDQLRASLISDLAGLPENADTASQVDIDRYILLGSPQLVGSLRYSLGVRPSVEEKIITVLSEHFDRAHAAGLFHKIKTGAVKSQSAGQSAGGMETLLEGVTLLEEFYQANSLEASNIGWNSPEPASDTPEVALRSSEGEVTLGSVLSSIAMGDEPFAKDTAVIIRDLITAVVQEEVAAFHGSEIGYLLGETNKPGDEVADLDLIFNEIDLPVLFGTGKVGDIISEEERHVITSFTDKEGQTFEGSIATSAIRVLIDPLDGSSKAETNGTVGKIMGLEVNGRMIASVIILFGAQTSLLFASEYTDEAWEYRLAEDGNFVKVRPFRVPLCRGKDRIGLALGGRRSRWAPSVIEPYVSYLETVMGGYSTYTGSFVSDLLRTVVDGGFYIYPALNDGKTKGRLRPYETRPVGYIFEKAGGALTTGIISNLAIALDTTHKKYPHQIEPIAIGSRDLVAELEAFVSNSIAMQLLNGMEQDGQLTDADILDIVAGKREPGSSPDVPSLKTYNRVGQLRRGPDQLHAEELLALAHRMDELIKFRHKINNAPGGSDAAIGAILRRAASQQNLILPIHMLYIELTHPVLREMQALVLKGELLMFPEKGGAIRLIVNVSSPEAVQNAIAWVENNRPAQVPTEDRSSYKETDPYETAIMPSAKPTSAGTTKVLEDVSLPGATVATPPRDSTRSIRSAA